MYVTFWREVNKQLLCTDFIYKGGNEIDKRDCGENVNQSEEERTTGWMRKIKEENKVRMLVEKGNNLREKENKDRESGQEREWENN